MIPFCVLFIYLVILLKSNTTQDPVFILSHYIGPGKGQVFSRFRGVLCCKTLSGLATLSRSVRYQDSSNNVVTFVVCVPGT